MVCGDCWAVIQFVRSTVNTFSGYFLITAGQADDLGDTWLRGSWCWRHPHSPLRFGVAFLRMDGFAESLDLCAFLPVVHEPLRLLHRGQSGVCALGRAGSVLWDLTGRAGSVLRDLIGRAGFVLRDLTGRAGSVLWGLCPGQSRVRAVGSHRQSGVCAAGSAPGGLCPDPSRARHSAREWHSGGSGTPGFGSAALFLAWMVMGTQRHRLKTNQCCMYVCM